MAGRRVHGTVMHDLSPRLAVSKNAVTSISHTFKMSGSLFGKCIYY